MHFIDVIAENPGSFPQLLGKLECKDLLLMLVYLISPTVLAKPC